jgi:hypothetical protein
MKMEQEIKAFQTMQKGELVLPRMMPVVSQFGIAFALCLMFWPDFT